ncbi:hypothetical protein DPMN_019319 [Dreissena polymorpha]|uniref:Uncharacterized protein n=1 Tax=Dreissena polymorpha TaxID=45954 RepID=A0A9D4NKJ0_DREPO|nr:hypothetical protein DPMN_019319 [Dreissena polymorpha]
MPKYLVGKAVAQGGNPVTGQTPTEKGQPQVVLRITAPAASSVIPCYVLSLID